MFAIIFLWILEFLLYFLSHCVTKEEKKGMCVLYIDVSSFLFNAKRTFRFWRLVWNGLWNVCWNESFHMFDMKWFSQKILFSVQTIPLSTRKHSFHNRKSFHNKKKTFHNEKIHITTKNSFHNKKNYITTNIPYSQKERAIYLNESKVSIKANKQMKFCKETKIKLRMDF